MVRSANQNALDTIRAIMRADGLPYEADAAHTPQFEMKGFGPGVFRSAFCLDAPPPCENLTVTAAVYLLSSGSIVIDVAQGSFPGEHLSDQALKYYDRVLNDFRQRFGVDNVSGDPRRD